MNNPQTTPTIAYSTRLTERKAQAAAAFAQYRKIGWARIAVLAIGLVIFFAAFFRETSQLLWWEIPVGILSLILLGIHQKTFLRRKRFERAVKFYERGLARLEGNWEGVGEAGEAFRDADHLYDQDLDIFGKGSLFELICTARTRAGVAILAAWLKAPATASEILARQKSVAELAPNLALREDLSLLGEDLQIGIHPEALIVWGQNQPLKQLTFYRLVTAFFCLLTVLGLAILFSGRGAIPLYCILLVNAVVGLWLRPCINEILRQVDSAARDLQLLSQVLERLEREQFSSEKLQQLRASLETGGLAPSQQIAQLGKFVNWLEARMNQLFRPISAPFFFVSQFALAVEAWRARSGIYIAKWIAAVGEIEALTALSGYAYEHPDDVFPEIKAGQKIFAATALGHPLIPENRVVKTDLEISGSLQLLVVSGSNMSGKSTLLRTIGMNAVLALAGAPVRAKSLRISPLQLGASIRIQDNLRAGASLFYAEITRLRNLMELTKESLPVLFIIDEILHGTNSHDRRIGSEAVLRGLVERGAFGLVTTHDLALTNIVNELQPRAKNVHFEDHLENGKMTFDYILREGVVQKSNALELMRSVGLDV